MADCVVLDLHHACFDVLAAFESRHVATPVVVITGHDEPEARRRIFCATFEEPIRSATTAILRLKAKGVPLTFWKTLLEVFI